MDIVTHWAPDGAKNQAVVNQSSDLGRVVLRLCQRKVRKNIRLDF